MNGRVYDYNAGRFLSVDPIIQAPSNSQSLNPYSYVMNNPLWGTDPSGYCSSGRIGAAKGSVCGGGAGSAAASLSKVKTTDKLERVEINQSTGTVTATTQNGGTLSVSNLSTKQTSALMDIGGQDTIARSDGAAPTTTSSRGTLGNSLPSDIQKQTQDTLSSIGQDFGYEYGEGVMAKYSEFGLNEEGNINQATITCDFVCQKDGAEYGKITADNIAQRAMIMSFRHSQGQTAQVLKYTLGTVGGGVLVGQALKYPAVAMSNLTQRQRSAVWGLVSEFASLMNSFKPPALSQPHLVGTFKYAPAAGHIIRTKARAPYSRQGGKSHVKVRDGKVVVKP